MRLEPGATAAHLLRMRTMNLLTRFLTFRNELATLWRAFMAPETPWHLKALTLLVPAYLLSPIDLIPDVVPLLGLLDDFVIVPMLVSMIVRMIPQPVRVHPDGSKEIDGTYRRRG